MFYDDNGDEQGYIGEGFDVAADFASEIWDAVSGGANDAWDVATGQDPDLNGGMIPGGGNFAGGGSFGNYPTAAGFGMDLAAAAGNPQIQAAAMSLVRSVMGSDVVAGVARSMLDALPNVIFDSSPPLYAGEQLSEAALMLRFRQLSKGEQMAIVERLSGMETPLDPGNKATVKAFKLLWTYDALRKLNGADQAEIIVFGAK